MPHQCTNCGRVFQDGSKEMLSGCPDCGGNKFQFKPASAVDTETASGGAAKPPDSSAPPDSTRDGRSDGRSGDGLGSSVREWVGGGEDAGTRDEPAADALDRDWPETASEPDRTGDTESVADPSAAGGATTTGDTADPATPSEDAVDRADEDGTADAEATGEESEASESGPEDRAQADARGGVVSPDELERAAERPPPTDADGQVIEPASDERPSLDELREELNDQFKSIKIINPGQYELNLMELYDRNEYIISLQEDGRYVIEVPDAWRDPEDD